MPANNSEIEKRPWDMAAELEVNSKLIVENIVQLLRGQDE